MLLKSVIKKFIHVYFQFSHRIRAHKKNLRQANILPQVLFLIINFIMKYTLLLIAIKFTDYHNFEHIL